MNRGPVNLPGHRPAATMREALASWNARVVSFSAEPDGRFLISEECDQHFGVIVTRKQLLRLAAELRTLAKHGHKTERKSP